MGDSYLPEDLRGEEDKKKEPYVPPSASDTVKIVSMPQTTKSLDIDRENRITALNAAAHQASGSNMISSSTMILANAKEYERYLKGESK